MSEITEQDYNNLVNYLEGICFVDYIEVFDAICDRYKDLKGYIDLSYFDLSMISDITDYCINDLQIKFDD